MASFRQATTDEAASALTALHSLSEAKPNEEEVNNEEGFSIPQRFTKSGRKKAVPFPLKLMKVLSDKEFENVITWMPSGKSFSIIEPKAFVAEILPEHFKSAKYASFTRKLHRWGFMRHYRGEEAGGFYHKMFRKDGLALVEQMTCHKMGPLGPQAAQKAVAKVTVVVPRPAQRPTQNMINGGQSLQQRMPAPMSTEAVGQLQHQLSLSGLQDGQMGAAERLNAAIEIEVARRLKERIQAAAVSRTTLALINQLNHPQCRASPNMPWNAMSGNLQVQLLQIQQQKQQLGRLKQPLGFGDQYAARMENKGLEMLPTTNIQGAKTA